jgi:hypothetical protein
MLEIGWGNSSNTWWVFLKIRVSKPTLNPNPTPCKKSKNQHKMDKTQFIAMDCVFGSLKLGEKNKKWWNGWVLCEESDFREMGLKTRPMEKIRQRSGGGEVAWCDGKGRVAVYGGVGLGLGVVRAEMGKWECTALRENEGGRGKVTLKKGHVRVLNKCTRSYQGALDRTRAEPCTACGMHPCSECVYWVPALEQT